MSFFQKKYLKKKLGDNDELAKYIFREKELRADGSIRPANLKPRQGEQLSLFEITGISHDGICKHGRDYANNPAKGRIHIGYGKFKHHSFVKLELRTIYDNKPPRHMSVEFPEEPERRRELSKALAGQLVSSGNEGKNKYFTSCL